MKHLTLFFVLALLAVPLQAQEQETLFSSPVEHGGFGGPVLKVSQIAGETGLLVGGYGGWLIGHRLMIGGGGYGLVTNIRAEAAAEDAYSPSGEKLYLEFGYGGVMLEYIIAPSKLLHFNVQTLIGAGSAGYREDWYDDSWDWHGNYRDRHEIVFVLEPAVHAELNLTTWFRVAGGVSYRYVNGIDELIALENSDFGGLSGNIAFKFGAF